MRSAIFARKTFTSSAINFHTQFDFKLISLNGITILMKLRLRKNMHFEELVWYVVENEFVSKTEALRAPPAVTRLTVDCWYRVCAFGTKHLNIKWNPSICFLPNIFFEQENIKRFRFQCSILDSVDSMKS